MREIIFDTETTGLKPEEGHRLIEIGCVEMVDLMLTGREFHTYLDPQRDVDEQAAAVHGLTREKLKDEPLFADQVEAFLTFIGEAPLVAHNAPFDRGFINAELVRSGRPPLASDRFIDTIPLVLERWPAQRKSLDAVCERLGIDTSRRTLHGALLDAQILADVYVELRGGRQHGLSLASDQPASFTNRSREFRPPRLHAPTPEELEAHKAFLSDLSDPVWNKIPN